MFRLRLNRCLLTVHCYGAGMVTYMLIVAKSVQSAWLTEAILQDLIDIYRTFHPKTMNFTFFSSAHGVLFIWSFLAVGVVVSMVCQGFFVREACVGDLLGGAGFRLSGVQCSVQ